MKMSGWLFLVGAAIVGVTFSMTAYTTQVFGWINALDYTLIRDWLAAMSGVFSAVTAVVAIWVAVRLQRRSWYKDYSELVDIFRTASQEYNGIETIAYAANKLCDEIEKGTVPQHAATQLLQQYFRKMDDCLSSESVGRANLYGGNLMQEADLADVRVRLFSVESQLPMVLLHASNDDRIAPALLMEQALSSAREASASVKSYITKMRYNTNAWAHEWNWITEKRFKSMKRSAMAFEARTRERLGESPQ